MRVEMTEIPLSRGTSMNSRASSMRLHRKSKKGCIRNAIKQYKLDHEQDVLKGKVLRLSHSGLFRESCLLSTEELEQLDKLLPPLEGPRGEAPANLSTSDV